ncbi:hypothetical protein CASFOL_008902 [Castilleja foliolosa]|uniref:PTBP1-like RNA recognition motif 2 domain-containing protein n=1 Tax=Castilleja foliolosa TaxID=1961234 RepID=A0ABD3E4D7_9LAMI
MEQQYSPSWDSFRVGLRHDLPKSDGSEPLTWLYKTRKYFEFYGKSPDERLRLVASMLEGPAADWFRWRMSSGLIDDWNDFVRKFKQRFTSPYYVDYFDRLKMSKPPREEEPSRILLVSIHNMLYPMTVEVLHQVFDPHGVVDKIVILQKSAGFQALIRYQSHESAISARDSLHGRDIYDGCCRLDIHFSDLDRLQVNFNGERAHDITVPTAAVEYKTENCHVAHSDKVKNLSTDTAHMKDVIVDVSDTVDPVPQTNQVEVSDMVVVLNKLDQIDDEELVELVVVEVRGSLTSSEIPGDNISIDCGSDFALEVLMVSPKIKRVENEPVDTFYKLEDPTVIIIAERLNPNVIYFLSYTLRTRWFLKRGRMLWIRAGQQGRGKKSRRWAETYYLACYYLGLGLFYYLCIKLGFNV